MNVTGSIKTPFLGSICITFSSFSFLGNIATLIILHRNKAFRNVSQARLFLANIAFVDLFSALSCLFSGIGFISGESLIKNKSLCKVEAYRRFISDHMQTLSITLLAVNRYYVMVKIRQSQQIFTKKRSILYILMLWGYSCVSAVVAEIVQPELAGYSIVEGTCDISFGPVLLPVIVLGILCPSIVVVFYCYIKIYKYFRARTQQVNANNLAAQEEVNREDVKLAKIFFVILFFFAISYIFNMSFFIYYVISEKAKSLSWIRVSLLVWFSNCVVNVVLYGLMNKVYRNELIGLFCPCRMQSIVAT